MIVDEDATSSAVAVVDEVIPPLLSLRAAAEVLGCSRTYVRTRCARHGVEPINLDAHHRAYVDPDVRAIAESRPPACPALPALLTPKAAADKLGINFNHVARALRAGELPGREVRASTGAAVAVAIRTELIEVVDQLATVDDQERQAVEVDGEHLARLAKLAETVERFR